MADAMALQQHRSRGDDSQPKTISPKDAVLDYKQDADDSSIPLFPQSRHSSQPQQHAEATSYAPHNGQGSQYSMPQTTFDFGQTSSQMKFEHNGAQYGPISFQPTNSQSSQQSLDFPAHLVSMETTKSEEKHKREDHRSTGHGGPPAASASPSASTMTQAGPHRCDRINPQTGKPCSTIFSRPYDLTRHEDTIHNRQKTKVRCHLCTDEKTFSRSDALTRHMKVVHPTAPWPAKHKKRI
ncbi:hypothetical protein FH972_023471 [Carpinus fangiana]|uniref:C2H2-type domain-containing protein n=1 Tax=Carpinus fangiana TaxID=176857 RepID=A0A5N6KVA0_9ROSI|nr:hypothetical protein FH972_023471 [Carpinus fangiana]